MKYLVKIFLLFSLCMVNCEHKIVEPYIISGYGFIYDYGELAVDGCDWVIVNDSNKTFHPSYLPNELLIDSLRVVYTYSPTDDEFTCGWNQKIPIIEIVGIESE